MKIVNAVYSTILKEYKKTDVSFYDNGWYDVVIESGESNKLILSYVRNAQIEVFGKTIPNSIKFITYSKTDYDFICNYRYLFPEIKEVIFVEENEDLTNYIKDMKVNKIIMNPPFHLGGEIWDKCREITSEISCLMPIGQYKDNKRYQFINTVKRVDVSLFKDTMIQDNLCITTCTSSPNKKTSFEEIKFNLFDEEFNLYYKWNSNHYRNLVIKNKQGVSYKEFNVDTDFIEIDRCVSSFSGAGFGQSGCGYKFNIDKKDYQDKWISHISVISLKSIKEKDNFSLWWYYKNKGKGLSSKSLIGLHIGQVGPLTKYAIPQIDWETISDHPLWVEGKYDEAVLHTMGLEWNEDKTGVVLK